MEPRASATRTPLTVPLALLILGLGAAPAAAKAGATNFAPADFGPITCYEDADGDGHGTGPAMTVVSYLPSDGLGWQDRLDVCPAGTAPRSGDCDDARADVHPRQAESANFRDDNCDGQLDEPVFEWPEQHTSWHTGESWIRVQIRFNDFATRLAAIQGRWVKVSLRIRPVGATIWQLRTYWVHPDSDTIATIKLTGLEAGTPYTAEVERIYNSFASGAVITNPLNHTVLHSESGFPYYTMTTGPPTDAVTAARADILTRGFYQFAAFRRGEIGYAGSVDPNGTRFGADLYEKWCSEFYVAIAGEVIGVQGSTVGGVAGWFEGFGSHYQDPVDGWWSIVDAAPGDYIWRAGQGSGATASSQASGHSLTFVAWTPNAQLVVLDGNWGNAVRVVPETATAEFRKGGLGRITAEMVGD